MTIRGLLRHLFVGTPDCAECGHSDPRTLHGSWWHGDNCSSQYAIARPEGSDDE